jgi:hypothetical protein
VFVRVTLAVDDRQARDAAEGTRASTSRTRACSARSTSRSSPSATTGPVAGPTRRHRGGRAAAATRDHGDQREPGAERRCQQSCCATQREARIDEMIANASRGDGHREAHGRAGGPAARRSRPGRPRRGASRRRSRSKTRSSSALAGRQSRSSATAASCAAWCATRTGFWRADARAQVGPLTGDVRVKKTLEALCQQVGAKAETHASPASTEGAHRSTAESVVKRDPRRHQGP